MRPWPLKRRETSLPCSAKSRYGIGGNRFGGLTSVLHKTDLHLRPMRVDQRIGAPLNPITPIAGPTSAVSCGDNLDSAASLSKHKRVGESPQDRPLRSRFEQRKLLGVLGDSRDRSINLVQKQFRCPPAPLCVPINRSRCFLQSRRMNRNRSLRQRRRLSRSVLLASFHGIVLTAPPSIC